MKPIPHKNLGFSLVEIAVVISVIGLILGGVIAGRHVLTASELNKVMQQAEFYNSAQIHFYDKYRAWPGDMYNATRYFGLDTDMDDDGSNESFCENGFNGSEIEGLPGTCNGDGDGFPGKGVSVSHNMLELGNWAQHLAAAGLIQGTYNGFAVLGGVISVGTATPNGPRDGTQWGVAATNVYDRAIYGFDTRVVGTVGVSISANSYAALTPEEAWSIDKKMDDGAPATGLIGPTNGNNSVPIKGARYCTLKADGSNFTQSEDTNAVYNINHPERACDLKFFLSKH